MGLILLLLVLFLLLGGYGHSLGWGYYGWSPLGLLVVVVIILLLAGVVHAEELAPVGAAGLLMAVVKPPATPVLEDDQTGPPGLPYAVSYWLGVLVMLYLAGAGYVTAEYVSGSGASLPWNLGTPQGFAALSLVTVIVSAFGRLLPNVQHTVAFRQRELLHARSGILPRDIKRLLPGGEPPAH